MHHRTKHTAGVLVAAFALMLAACSRGDSAGSTTTVPDSENTTADQATPEDSATTSPSTHQDDEELSTRDVKAGGLDSDLCEDLDPASINEATGLEFTYLTGEEEHAGTYGSVSCTFGLAEASSNYLYVDWQVRSQAFAADNYAKEVSDATETTSTASPYEHGDWDDASLILGEEATTVRVIVLDDNAVYSVRLSLEEDLPDREAVAAAMEPFIEQLSGKVLED